VDFIVAKSLTKGETYGKLIYMKPITELQMFLYNHDYYNLDYLNPRRNE